MALSSLTNSLRTALNRANLGSVHDFLRAIAFGNFVRSTYVFLRSQAAATISYTTGTKGIQFPDYAKGIRLDRVYARAGTGTKGVLTVDNGGYPSQSVPAAGHALLSPSGDLVLAAADAWTSVDVYYQPEKQLPQEQTLAVATNAATMPTGPGATVSVLEVESLVGTLTGKLAILVPGSSPSTGQCALSLDKLTLNFASADAVTSARVKFGVVNEVDLNAVLEAASPII